MNSDAAVHLGRERMEAATWHLPRRSRSRRPLSRGVRVALAGRLTAVVLAAVVFASAASFGRPEPGRPVDRRGRGFSWSAFEPTTGRQVPREEWVARALAAASTP